MSELGLHKSPGSVNFIGVASALGGPNPGTADGPVAVQASGALAALRRSGRPATWRATLAPRPQAEPAQALRELVDQLAAHTEAALREGALPVVVGGDHSCAIGTWRGVARAAAAAPGLVWIDAHLDAHTPASSHTGRLHGMPLACLLGAGEAPLLAAGDAVLDPARLVVIGVRSSEPEEEALLGRLGVRVFAMDEVRRRGLEAVFAEALDIARAGGAGFGVSIDLDALDPADAPGVGLPVAGGIAGADLARVLRRLRDRGDLLALEVVEFDPHYDSEDRSLKLVAALLDAALAPGTEELVAMEERHGAHNYDPLPMVLVRGEGCHLWDSEGRRYLDMMSAYSANSLGHANPRLLAALNAQAQRLALTSRAYRTDRLPAFLARLTQLTGYARALPMNTGAEAVETALKAARKWAHEVKGVANDAAEIIACEGNFHGRTIAIVGMSSEAQYRQGFGPFPPGFRRVPYGDAAALEAAITPDTAAFLVEPVQGEAGIVLPPPGYLARCERICRHHGVLLICDEVQTGLGRTGRLLACEHEGVRPDAVVLGKALGGGLLPVSALLADDVVMQVFRPGDHGSTFGGNPLAAAVALEALDILVEDGLAERAAVLGRHLLRGLRAIDSPLVAEVRGLGLLVGVELRPELADARELTEALAARGLLTKDTHGTVLRFAPPLVVTREQIDWAVGTVRQVLDAHRPRVRRAA